MAEVPSYYNEAVFGPYMTYEEQAYDELQRYLDAGYSLEQIEKAGGYEAAIAAGPVSTKPTQTVVRTGDQFEVVPIPGLTNGRAYPGPVNGTYTQLPGGAGGEVKPGEQLMYLSNGGAKMPTNGYASIDLLKTGQSVEGVSNLPQAMQTGIDWSMVLGIGNTIWNLIQQFTGGGGSGGAVATTPGTALVPYTGAGAGAGGAVATPEQYGLTGPGIPEPPAGSYSKTWRIETEDRTGRKVYTYFWRMWDNSIIYYSTSGKVGKYKPKKPIATVMPGGKMNMRDFVKLDRYLDKMTRTIAKRSKRLKLQ